MIHRSTNRIMDLNNDDIELRQMNDGSVSDQESAVLVVGSTGTGKSSTIAKCTNQPIRIGDGYETVTRYCQVYK